MTTDFLQQLGMSGELLAHATTGQVYDSLPIDGTSPLVVDKATRDRMVIFDPSCAPLVRPALAPDDLRAWHHLPPSRFLIAIPRGWSANIFGQNMDEEVAFAALSARHPSLAKQLAPRKQALESQPHGTFWWELPPYPVDFFGTQLIAWLSTNLNAVASVLSGAYLLGGLTFTTAPTPFLLGLLGSHVARAAARELPDLSAAHAVNLPMPQANEAEQVALGMLAEQLVEHAQERLRIERETLGRIMRDLAPPGATPGPVLARWWELDFAAFLGELERRFKGDVPFRYREQWQEYLGAQRLALAGVAATIAGLEGDLNQHVYRLFRLDAHAVAAVEASLAQAGEGAAR